MEDLEAADAKMVKQAIEESESLDRAVCEALASFPTVFHAAMIEDLRSMDAEETEKHIERQIEEADAKLWQAKVSSFESLLLRDLATIKRASAGHTHLKDRFLDTCMFIFLSSLSMQFFWTIVLLFCSICMNCYFPCHSNH